jgi:hypothetical protein
VQGRAYVAPPGIWSLPLPVRVRRAVWYPRAEPEQERADGARDARLARSELHPSDYRFLFGLLDRLLEELGASALQGRRFDSARPVGIDAPVGARKRRRDERIAAAIDASWDECTLFVVHGDGAGDPEGARRSAIEPGLALARTRHPDLAAAACVPVREIEAWMLADAGAFSRIFRTDRAPELPRDPESEIDPKRVLAEVLQGMGAQLDDGAGAYHDELGREVRPAQLRRLPAFRQFEADLRAAVEAVGRPPRP